MENKNETLSDDDLELLSIVQCPKCGGTLGPGFVCTTHGGFPIVHGQPALIDFERSILDRGVFERTDGLSPIRRRTSIARRLVDIVVNGKNPQASRYAAKIVERAPGGRVLIIGGGAIGSGADQLYSGAVKVLSTDIYPSSYTRLVADGHQLPFHDETFDAVWIQAVLEHVIEPSQVAAEIWRVLRPGGLIYADTPFMQHVHEGAYDFTRFTLSGHRWLFRRFKELDSGVVAGAGTMLLWSIRYFFFATTGSKKVGTLLSWPFFWLRFFNGRSRAHADSASGVFFFGEKADAELHPRDVVKYYNGFGQSKAG